MKHTHIHALSALAMGIIAAFSMPAALADENDIINHGGAVYDPNGPKNDDSNIAIGPGSKVYLGPGTQESQLSFGEEVQKTMKTITFLGHTFEIQSGWNIHYNEGAKKNLPAAIAVGQNTFARTGSIEIGSHTLEKKDVAIGDTTATQLKQFGAASTTLGTNSYTGGSFATTLGSYNVQSSPYDGPKKRSDAAKNSFATVVGTLNSNESMDGRSYSGIANAITGTANKVTNSNGALVYGAGNEVKNSWGTIYKPGTLELFDSVADMQKAIMEGVSINPGGAAMVIGGGNKVTKSTLTQVMGVSNSSTDDKISYVDGYKNTLSDSKYATIIGSHNKATDVDNTQVIGDFRNVTGSRSAVLGSADSELALTASEAVVLGYNANVTQQGGVAIGFNSIASTASGITGWAPQGVTAGTDHVWKATAAAVSVGDLANNITRQITGVAAGTADTDAVNVAQLKALQGLIGNGSGGTVKEGDRVIDVKKTSGDNGTTYTITSKTQFEGDSGSAAVIGGSEDAPSTLKIRGGASDALSDGNIGVVSNGSDTLQVKLAKDVRGLDTLSVNNSVTVGGTSITSSGVTIEGGPSVTKTNIDMGGQQVHSVAAGTAPTDAVNVSQLQDTKNQMYSMKNDLSHRIDKAGASAAALAALHPLDFDPDHRFMVSAGLGHYKSREGVAVGAFWYPTDTGNMLLSAGYSSSASDSHMVNVGLTYRFGGDFRHAVNYREIAMREQNRGNDLEARLSASQSREENLARHLDDARARAAKLESELTAVKAQLNDLSAKVEKLIK
ncbi:MAG: hypothetical protein ACFWTZ_04965 [Burkholderia sp.]|jgi:trimeric autotransporter adhesin